MQIEDDGFGMGGTGGSLGWWSNEGRYAIGFVTGYVADHDRVTRLDNAVRGCLDLPPLSRGRPRYLTCWRRRAPVRYPFPARQR